MLFFTICMLIFSVCTNESQLKRLNPHGQSWYMALIIMWWNVAKRTSKCHIKIWEPWRPTSLHWSYAPMGVTFNDLAGAASHKNQHFAHHQVLFILISPPPICLCSLCLTCPYCPSEHSQTYIILWKVRTYRNKNISAVLKTWRLRSRIDHYQTHGSSLHVAIIERQQE